MADDLRTALIELLRRAEFEVDAEIVRNRVCVLVQVLMVLEVTAHLGAERHERTLARSGHRNGNGERALDTEVGFVELLVPGRPVERALVAVVQEDYVQGVSRRREDDFAKALGLNGISKSQVSRLRQALDAAVERFQFR